MNKKLIALAVAGATFAPAVMAQSANPVTLYGRIWVMANSVKAEGGPAVPISNRVTVVDESSLIGFRGTEDLGGGLKAWFQLESSAPPDAGGGTFGSRNSGVGLQGGFGTIVLGKWDSPMKLSAIFVDPYGQNTIGNQLAVINVSDFNRRENNMIQYWTPNWSGFSARFMYGANEGKTATANPSNGSFYLDYAKGPFRINYAYEKHKDQRGATVTAGVTEKQQNVAGTAVFGPIKLGLLFQKMESTGRTDRHGSEGSAVYTAGKNQFIINYGRNRNGGSSAAGTVQPETKMLGVGYDYNFSKRTTFMMRYADIKNNSVANLSQAAFGFNTAPAADQDPKGFGAGFRHTF
jgi:predicted porin